MLEFIENQFLVRENGRKYALQATFEGDNPFFGVFFQNLRESKVLAFQLVVASDIPGTRMTVTKDGISLVTDSLSSFRTNVERAFCLTAGME